MLPGSRLLFLEVRMHALTAFVDSLEVPALTKSALVDMLIEQMGLNGREAVELVESFFELILERLSKGEDVKLAGFGNFEVRQKRERPGRNPRVAVAHRQQQRAGGHQDEIAGKAVQ